MTLNDVKAQVDVLTKKIEYMEAITNAFPKAYTPSLQFKQLDNVRGGQIEDLRAQVDSLSSLVTTLQSTVDTLIERVNTLEAKVG